MICASLPLMMRPCKAAMFGWFRAILLWKGGCIIHQLLKSKRIFEYWIANFNAALCHADLLNAVSGVADVLNFFFSMMQLGTFGSSTMMYGQENGSNCQRCTSNFCFMAPLFLSLLCKITLAEEKVRSITATSFGVHVKSQFGFISSVDMLKIYLIMEYLYSVYV